MNHHYIYVWKEQGIAGSGLPFYVGQGTHQSHARYPRAYAKHLDSNQKGRLSYAQKKANKLARLGVPHIVEILHDNLTQSQADEIEIQLVARLGRKVNNTGILYNISGGGDVNPMHDADIRAKHLAIMQSNEHREAFKVKISHIFTEAYREAKSAETRERLNDPVKKAAWYAKFNTPETIERMRSKQADISGKPIEYKGIVFRSKKELARHLGISSQLLSFRLRKDIPLDLVPSKSNRRNKEF